MRQGGKILRKWWSGSGGKEEGLVCDKGLCGSWGAFSDAAGYLRDVRHIFAYNTLCSIFVKIRPDREQI